MEVQVNFRSGELYVQAKDGGGKELSGDTRDFECFWGVEVFQNEDMNRDYGASCAFPAHFVLATGTYTVRSWNGQSDVWMEGIKVVEGETTVRSAVFKEE